MTKFRVRLMRTVSHETEIQVDASSGDEAMRTAKEKARFLVWDHRNNAEYEILWVKTESSDEEETKFG